MTTSALFLCDGAPEPPGLDGDPSLVRRTIDWRSPLADLNLRADNLWDTVLDAIDHRAADLVRIAACAYAADQDISRGGRTDVYGRRWRRSMMMAIPVSDPAFWSDEGIIRRLEAVLSFVTEDSWQFSFSLLHRGVHQLSMQPGDRELLGQPDCVVLFSGGADSLCATVELIAEQQARPLLVSHRPSPMVDSRQRQLVGLVRERFSASSPAHISFWVHRKGGEATDTSQRSRAFLFASLGAAVAGQLGISRVVLADNGVVSLNLPINAQLLGALASRSTHPKFLWLFNDLIGAMFDPPIRVENTFALRTRSEVLSVLKTAGCEALLQESNSCSRTRGLPAVQPHCGGCYQCVDRRFGTIAAGLEESDLAERYRLDIFVDALPEGDRRTTCESYVRFARKLRTLGPEQMFLEIPELFTAILPNSQDVHGDAAVLTGMLKRHADAVAGVLSAMIGRWRDDLASADLPETCLLRLAVGTQARPRDKVTAEPEHESENLFRREGTNWRVRFDGQVTFVVHAVGMEYLAYLLRAPEREIDASEMVAAVAGRPATRISRDDLNVLRTSETADAIIDKQTGADYRGRLRELTADRAAAERDGDVVALAGVNEETEAIERELADAKALGGRTRTFQRDRERARQAVSRAIDRAVERIAKAHPALGRHLKHSITTGSFCVYRPERPTSWVV